MSNVRRPRRLQFKTARARELRATAGDAEKLLWYYLRRKKVGGVRFRRQHPMGPFIADFYCPAAKLIVEVDGGQHSEEANVAYDERRTRWLNEHGYRVLRFWNHDVLSNSRGVLDTIWHAVRESGVPLPIDRVLDAMAAQQNTGES